MRVCVCVVFAGRRLDVRASVSANTQEYTGWFLYTRVGRTGHGMGRMDGWMRACLWFWVYGIWGGDVRCSTLRLELNAAQRSGVASGRRAAAARTSSQYGLSVFAARTRVHGGTETHLAFAICKLSLCNFHFSICITTLQNSARGIG